MALPDRVAVVEEQLDRLAAATQMAMEDDRDAEMALRDDREGIGPAAALEGR